MARTVKYLPGDIAYNIDDLAKLVILRGSPHEALDAIAVATCWVESRGHTGVWAQNDIPGSPADKSWDRGLWQINSYWHPEVSDVQAADPDAICDAVFRITGGFANWNAWASYTGGYYQQYMDQATAAVKRHAKPLWWKDWWEVDKAPIKICAKGWDVAYLQDVLRVAVGQYCATTGTFDGDTLTAVNNLQGFWKLPVTGIVDKPTWAVVDWSAKTR